MLGVYQQVMQLPNFTKLSMPADTSHACCSALSCLCLLLLCLFLRHALRYGKCSANCFVYSSCLIDWSVFNMCCHQQERLGGKYLSISITITARAPELINKTYEEIGKDPRVKMKF